MAKYLILIILHLLGDFYLQTSKVAQCKNARKRVECGTCEKCGDNSWMNGKYLFMHSLLYVVPFVSLYFIANGAYVTVVICVLLMTHIVIDAVSCFFNKKSKQTIVFIVDQFLHIGIIGVLSQVVVLNSQVDGQYYAMLKVIAAGLLLIMPCSITINKLFKDMYPQSEEMGMFDIGSIIGIMERILTFIFACFQSFPAIAIIITVKTWARTNDLKEPEFRNKYLLGTLTSLVLALCVFTVYTVI